MRASDMRLRLKDDQIIESSSINSILSVLDQTSQTGAVVAGLIGAPFGVLTMFAEERSKQTTRESQLRAGVLSLFEDRKLSKGKKETGIVLFHLQKAMKVADGATLMAWVVDPTSAEGLQINVPLLVAQ